MSRVGGRVLALLATLVLLLPADGQGGSVTGPAEVRSLEILKVDSEGLKLSHPSTLYFDAAMGEIYATDDGKSQLVVYGPDYFPRLTVGAGRGLDSVYGAFVHQGRIYACVGPGKTGKAHIAELNEAFIPVRKIYFSGFKGAEDFIPRKLVIGSNGNFYVVGVQAADVIVFDADGKYLRSIMHRVEVLGVREKAPIVSLAVGQDGKLYFLSEEAGKIFVYGPDEKLLYSFGEKGGVSGKLSRPRGIAVDDRRQRIYVVDYLRHAVSAFNMQGGFLFDFGGMGIGRGWFQFPTDLVVDERGNLLVSDSFNNRIQVFCITEREPVVAAAVEPAEVRDNLVAMVAPQEPSPEVKELAPPVENAHQDGAWIRNGDGALLDAF